MNTYEHTDAEIDSILSDTKRIDAEDAACIKGMRDSVKSRLAEMSEEELREAVYSMMGTIAAKIWSASFGRERDYREPVAVIGAVNSALRLK